jgi:hypothetical protein
MLERETIIINNSDFVKVTKEVETVRNERKSVTNNKTTRSYFV